MPTLDFKGKPFVYSHHLSVPFRELVVDAKKSLPAKGQKPSLEDNLIIHGDNLEALKALLPRYAGKVDVIYIDPPYNTGNEGWAYNDNVNSPLMKEWLGKVVDRDDLERHDKWCCMMWPRLQLLRELLADDGIIFVSMDENEISNLYPLMDEIFGQENRFENLVWKKRYGGGPKEKFFVNIHEYIVVYAKNKARINQIDRPLTPSKIERYYKLADAKLATRGPYRRQPLEAAASMDERENLRYSIVAPDQSKIRPKYQWLWEESRFLEAKKAGEIEFLQTKDGWSVQYKQYLNDESGEQRSEKQQSVLSSNSTFIEGIYTQTGTAELREILADDRVPYPKPSALIEILLETRFAPADNRKAIVLDSFAGSGTTAHAVLAANKKDGGQRKFVLIEMESYADGLTAERVRRVAKGVKGSKSSDLRSGFGGSFAFCELGDALDLDRFFDGKGAPSYEQIARYVIYTATGNSIPEAPKEPRNDWFIGEAGGYRIHLIYKPDLDFMRGNDAALSMPLAEQIAKAAKGKPILIYAAAKFMSQNELTRKGITFCQLPYAVHRILGEAPDAS
jgi:adenine-specific DNA-methyltransferase